MKRLLMRGFTLVEVLIVIFVMGIIALLVINNISGSTERAYYSRTVSEFTTFANALNLYSAKYNTYPDDVNRGLPASLNEFIAKNEQGEDWPDAPWPGSVYDYENWPDLDGVDTYQISVRFCPAGGPLTACKFPKETWVNSSWGLNSSVYYCLKGNCRAHQNEAKTYPGYCLNCPNHVAIGA